MGDGLVSGITDGSVLDTKCWPVGCLFVVVGLLCSGDSVSDGKSLALVPEYEGVMFFLAELG